MYLQCLPWLQPLHRLRDSQAGHLRLQTSPDQNMLLSLSAAYAMWLTALSAIWQGLYRVYILGLLLRTERVTGTELTYRSNDGHYSSIIHRSRQWQRNLPFECTPTLNSRLAHLSDLEVAKALLHQTGDELTQGVGIAQVATCSISPCV